MTHLMTRLVNTVIMAIAAKGIWYFSEKGQKQVARGRMCTAGQRSSEITFTMHLRTSWKVSFQVLSANFWRRSEMTELITEPKKKKKEGGITWRWTLRKLKELLGQLNVIETSASRRKNLPRKKTTTRNVLVGVAINQLQNTLNQRHLFTHLTQYSKILTYTGHMRFRRYCNYCNVIK